MEESDLNKLLEKHERANARPPVSVVLRPAPPQRPTDPIGQQTQPPSIAEPGFAAFKFLYFLFTLCAAFAVYGMKDGTIVALVIAPFLFIPTFLGRFPLFGPLLYWAVEKHFILNLLFVHWFPAVHQTWLTDAFFWIGLAVSIRHTLRSYLIWRMAWAQQINSTRR